ncbi:MAG: hypothetical protein NXH91_13350 [Phyllobacteriaceae bacterium]|nr:hypothetical protein [Phyllobacteriaceae bacterium]
MTRPEAIASTLLLLPVMWAAVHLGLSRIAELQANRREKTVGTADDDVTMLRNRARTMQDMSRLMPNWMLLVLAMALIWRLCQLTRSIWA